jgi:hypothetical protein
MIIGDAFCAGRANSDYSATDTLEQSESPLARQISEGMTEEQVVKLLGDPDGTLCLNKLAIKSVYYVAHGVTLSYGRDNRVAYICNHRHPR